MPFKRGQSGNPAGRPVGSRNKRTIATERLFGPNGERFAQLAIELAKMGHPAAVRLCLDRVWPRARRPAFRLPAVTTPKDALNAMALIVQGVADGELTPAQAAMMSIKVCRASRAVAPCDHARRLGRLEAIVTDRREHRD